jgi:hypothetical protein
MFMLYTDAKLNGTGMELFFQSLVDHLIPYQYL